MEQLLKETHVGSKVNIAILKEVLDSLTSLGRQFPTERDIKNKVLPNVRSTKSECQGVGRTGWNVTKKKRKPGYELGESSIGE